MSNEIVKYHNDFNKIQLPRFTEQEQNLLFLIFAKIKEKGAGNIVELYARDLQLNNSLANSREYTTEVIDSLKHKFFKADFRQIIETDTEIIDKTINLFQEMQIHYVKRDPDDGYDESKLFNRMVLSLNPSFAYIINQLTSNFTIFELAEFMNISGKYTKTLYRLLKQYRTRGIMRIAWDEFLRVMDIPKNKTTGDIDKFILKPAIKELTKERNLFDQIRIPFKNLSYEKLKDGKQRGRGGKVVEIIFRFLPENIISKPKKIDLNSIVDFDDFKGQSYLPENADQIIQIKEIQIEDERYNLLDESNNVIFSAPDKDQFMREIKKGIKRYENKEQMNKMLAELVKNSNISTQPKEPINDPYLP